MREIEKIVKQIRNKSQQDFYNVELDVSYLSPGEMRGYLNVLKYISPNPLEDE